LHEQKKFFQALENEGGLNTSVKKVCDSDTAAFGKCGSARRRQFRNRANYFWNGLKAKEYFALLDTIGITPSLDLKRSASKPPVESDDEEASVETGKSFASPAHRLP
jgi:hypothetical protein